MLTNYNKLVPDRIPQLIESDGSRVKLEVLDDARSRYQLLAKLVEEA